MKIWESFLFGVGAVAVLSGIDLMPELWTVDFWFTVVGIGLLASVTGSIAKRIQEERE